jgi:1,4-dihydroxy-6-naphthoate synthase
VSIIRLAFSPDSDDLFMFWPLLSGRVPSSQYRFEHVRADTETLNRRALQGDLDVVAISIATYPAVAKDYLLLPHGGSVGRGYGPALVSNTPRALAALADRPIAVPGAGTTAYLVLRLLLPNFQPVFVPISPYSRVFSALRAGEVEAALLIHEGRLTYEKEGFALVADVGQAFAYLTGGLPLPLGGNVIRRALGDRAIADISDLLRRSIEYALAHRDALIDELLAKETRREARIDRATLDRYLTMYANGDTLAYPEDARRAVEELFARGRAAGLLPEPDAPLTWAP